MIKINRVTMKKSFYSLLFIISMIFTVSCKMKVVIHQEPVCTEYTVEDFIKEIGNSVEIITYDSSKPGITKSEDGKTVNIYNVKISGEFSFETKFPHGLESADLRGLDTSNVTDMSSMFNSSSLLKTIYVSDKFITNSVKNSNYMFNGCSKLVGAISYNSNKTDARYANTKTGYFTLKR